MKRILTLLLVLITISYSNAQERCGFDIMHDKLMSSDTNYGNHVQKMNAHWSAIQNAMINPLGNYIYNGYGQEYVIPVVVHVIHTGGSVGTIYNPHDTVIDNAIDYLNQTYAATWPSYVDTNNGGVRFPIKFVLAKRSSSCGSTSGIIRINGTSLSGYSSDGVKLSGSSGASEADVKALSRWNNRDYYNIWVVNKIDGKDGTSGSFTAGYAYFPGANDTIDGTVILATRMKAGFSTLPHELGHAFNLYHTFEGDGGGASCPSNTTCSAQGDLVCDTDPHKRNASTCPSDAAYNTCTGLTWANAYTHKNIMDYSSCRNRFTSGQRTRWLDALTTYRPGLGSSIAALDTGANTIAASCTPSTTTHNPYNMGIVKVALSDMTSNSTTSQYANPFGYTDRTCQQRSTMIQDKSYTLSIDGGTSNNQDVEVYIDYNNDGTFGTGENVYSGSNATTFSTSYAAPTSGVTTCTPLRMRVIVDWFNNTITGPCYNPQYGEVEDFSVLFKPASDTVTITNSITAGSNPTCSAGSVTFTASASKTLSSPSYQWYLNSAPVGSNSATYTASSLSTGTYYVRCLVKYTGACYSDSMMSNVIPLTVNGTTVTPSVSIAASSSTICSGTSVTFTPTPTNGGTSPTYQWKLNGSNIATGSTYTTTTLSNGDQVSCVMTSNATCASPTTATSNTVTMTVTANVTPSVSISSSAGSSICSGTSVTFTPTPTNGGGAPTYQWKLNGGNVATGSTYTTTTLANGDQVSCVMTSSATCASPTTATSNTVTMTITTSVTPSVTIAATATNICSGTSVTFTPTPTNGGTSPTYQWKLNGSNIATGSTYTTTTLSNGDQVSCVMTSNATCASPTTATSNTVTMTVNPNLTPSVTIAATATTICSGTSVTFTPTPTNGGTSPAYQWKVNGSNVATGSTYTTTTLANGDQITCVMTSNDPCASPTTATSNTITMTVNPNLTPAVTIAVSPNDTICAGTNVTFTPTPTNGGTAPVYQWKLNGSNIATGATYITNTLSNNDVVSVEMTSNETCLATTTATSNSITMTVNPNLTPAVTIAVSPNDTICAGTNVTFTPTPTNGGPTPTYQWKVNGTNTATGNTFSSSTLVNNDAVTVEMTSSETCLATPTGTSNTITMTVNANLTPAVTIAVSPNDTICAGTNVTFTPTPTNGGPTPTYQWKVNGSNTATGGTFSTTTLANGDAVTVELTSSEVCVTSATATSSAINMTVIPLTVPGINILASTGTTICQGSEVTFSSNTSGSGTSQTYQWTLNGTNISGANGTTYTTNTLNGGDAITCKLKITAACPSPDSAESTPLIMTIVNPALTVSVSPNDTICDNVPALFSVNPTNVGTTPLYQWYVNGSVVIGATYPTYTHPSVSHGDKITASFTGSANCVNAAPVAGDTVTMTVNATAAPAVSITANPGASVPDGQMVWFTSSVNAVGIQYQWRKNGFDIPGATGIMYTLLNPQDGDEISLWIRTSDSCRMPDTAISNTIVLQVGVGVATIKTPVFDDVSIAPNPNTGLFTLEGVINSTIDADFVNIEVVNTLGAVIHKEQVQLKDHELKTRIDLGDKAHNGLHIVRIHAGGHIHLLKFIVGRL